MDAAGAASNGHYECGRPGMDRELCEKCELTKLVVHMIELVL